MPSKKVLFYISSALVFGLLTGCGMAANTNEDSNGRNSDNPKQEEVMANFETFIEAKEENNAITVNYKVKNISSEPQKLTFPTGLEADFIVYDQDGKKIKQYSDEVSSTQVIKEISLEKDQEIEEGFTIADLSNGQYVIEVFLTANEKETKAVKDLLVENSLILNGTGVLNGQMDPHTIEMNIEGEPRAFQLTEKAQQQYPSLKEGEQISFVYKENDLGQQVIVRFIIEQE